MSTVMKEVNMSLDDIISKNKGKSSSRHSNRGMREDIQRKRRNPYRHSIKPQSRNKAGTKLLVRNLHHDVSEFDLRQLFEDLGPVHKVNMKFDRSGRSEGRAEIFFQHEEHAKLAIEKYNGKPLDGLNLEIEILNDLKPKLDLSREYMQLDE